MDLPKEADIEINGRKLRHDEAMTLRVAITSFYAEMRKPNALGEDSHGIFMAKAYSASCKTILETILNESL